MLRFNGIRQGKRKQGSDLYKEKGGFIPPFSPYFVVQDAKQDLIVARAENSLQEIDIKRPVRRIRHQRGRSDIARLDVGQAGAAAAASLLVAQIELVLGFYLPRFFILLDFIEYQPDKKKGKEEDEEKL